MNEDFAHSLDEACRLISELEELPASIIALDACAHSLFCIAKFCEWAYETQFGAEE